MSDEDHVCSIRNVPMAERIEWLMQWDAKVKVRVYYSPYDQSYEILFKHDGDDKWHEFILTDYSLRHDTLHDSLAPLRTMLRMTKP